MNKKKKIVFIFITILLLIVGITSMFFYIKSKQKEETPTKVIEVLDSINGFDYKLEDRDTEIYKTKFLELKKILEEEKVDNEKYASLLAELFTIDLYTIDNKISKYDVGALDFIYKEEQEKFKNKVTNTLYKLVEDNSNNNRKQDLPIVKETEVEEIKNTKYSKGKESLDGYNVLINITYEKDLGYDKSVLITVIEENNKMYVVSIKSDEV